VIVLDPKGKAAFSYSSEGMYRGYVTADGKYHVKIYEK
jgi:isoaspartyl peptidase/L-asparaginase-like protein (Ntn-hydrolase superfamily)